MTTIQLQPNKKIYFASDFHLGYPDFETSLIREKKIISWLDNIQTNAQVIFLVGDIFDFWFEYKNVVPKGYVRLLGKLAELTDSGIEVIIFSGNHDIWMFDYFTKELGIKVYRNAQEYIIENIEQRIENRFQSAEDREKTINILTPNPQSPTFYIVHGDGLGPGDYGYKYLKKVFESKLSQWAFGWLHPQVGISLATWWSGSRKDEERIKRELQFRGEGEWLWHFAKEQEAQKHHDYYIFGHRHLLLDLPVGESSRYINLGQWAYDDENSNHFAVFDGEYLEVKKFHTQSV
ncbi:MAG: UDP-2,3-diacylglucosamine diphosphatase [Arcicella sp.]|nr:UDP-2,3-diacylglucosamine diphosphatase [Arcicella sp.]